MAMTLLATNSGTVTTSSFTSSIDNTYKLYIFKFYDVNPATDSTHFSVQGSIDGGSNYNVAMTTTNFRARHYENDSSTNLDYQDGSDQAQGTGFQILAVSVGNGADESAAGALWLFNPSNTTYVKHFYSTANLYDEANISQNEFVGGYFNTTSAINAIQFKMSSGDMDAVIKMYGVG